MTKHDLHRLAAIRKSLQDAKNRVETAALYLTVNSNDNEMLMDLALCNEHIEIAVGLLAQSKEVEQDV